MALFIIQPAGQALLLIGLGAAVGYAVALIRSQAALKGMVRDWGREFNSRIQQLESAAKQAAAQPAPAPLPVLPVAPPSAAGPTEGSQSARTEEMSPETLLIIAAAVTAYLGRKVRVRSAKMLQSPYEIINPWAQQGRVFVQASHNLARGSRD